MLPYTGAGGAIYSNCDQIPSICKPSLKTNIYIAPFMFVPSIKFSSNIAKLYGNNIATEPTKFVALGETFNDQINLCGEQELIRNKHKGN
jgi:hypothetical protein